MAFAARIGARPSSPNPTAMGSNVFAALVLIVLGLFFLARNLGWIDSGLGSLLATWWPAILVAVGVGMLLRRK